VAAARAARELGLALGRDLDLVGWCAEGHWDRAYEAAFGPGQVPPTVTWSVTQMAEAALARLAERRAHPELPTMRMNIETRLRAPGGAAAGEASA
jgi:hypothetical protein